MIKRIFTVLSITATGCGSQEYAECDPPRSHLEIMYKPSLDLLPTGPPFCIVCNTAIESPEYESWATEMGATQLPSSVDLVHPCLYVYTANHTSIESIEQCTSLVCDGDAVYNDMVGTSNGNFDLSLLIGD